MWKLTGAFIALLFCLTGCNSHSANEDSLAPGEVAKWNDPNFEIMVAGAYNYTGYDIYDVFILPPEKNDINDAASTSGGKAIQPTDDQWHLTGMGPNFAWNYRWQVPKKFKIWWFQVIDQQASVASSKSYDKYTSKNTAPGGEWCQAEVEVRDAPKKGKSNDFVLHFFPDGHVEADIAPPEPRVAFKDRSTPPKLKGQTCLHAIQNPYFGKQKPVEQY